MEAANDACKQAIEQGLAAEHTMDLRKAVLCFEVDSPNLLLAMSANTAGLSLEVLVTLGHIYALHYDCTAVYTLAIHWLICRLLTA